MISSCVKLFVLCTMLFTSYLFSENISVKQYTPEEIKTSPELKMLTSSDTRGHYLIVFHFPNFPKNKEITLSIKRLLQKNKDSYQKISKFLIFNDERFIVNGEIHPFFAMTSAGFLPGEKVHCRFTTADNEIREEIAIIPHPIKVEGKLKEISIEAELTILNPTSYNLHIFGIKKGEEIKFHSISGKEELNNTIPFYGADLVFGYMNGVLGKEGGHSQVTLQNSTKDEINLNLPWGIELLDYNRGDLVYHPVEPIKVIPPKATPFLK